MTDSDDVQLAIVIPVWRGRFLAAALNSLREQTNQRFRVYICDDCSPDDIPSIVGGNGMGLDIVYHRFSANLGRRDLVKHWDRCLTRVTTEDWLWLFADDDEVMPDTVASFYQKRVEQPLARFFCMKVQIIDELGVVKKSLPEPPAEEDAFSLLSALLTRQGREVRGADHLFTRELFEECGGFVWMPQAMYADLATWVAFTDRAKTKYRLEEGGLRWRQHGESVSLGNWDGSRRVFLDAMMQFTEWVDRFIDRYPTAIKRQLSRELFDHYCATFRGLPGEPKKEETKEVFRQVSGLRNSGGYLRAIRTWIISRRGHMRGWLIVSIWCRWRYGRSGLVKLE